MKGFKGFKKDLTCHGLQFKEGETFEHNGEMKLCSSGFHFCENPIDVFQYYSPSTSRFMEIEGEDVSVETDGDSKRVCKKILIKKEISLKAMIDASIKFIFSKVDWGKAAAQTHGDSSAAQTHGHSSAAQTHGDSSAAVAFGSNSKAKAKKIGSWITLDEWKDGERIDVKTAKIDGKELKTDTWYQLVDGKFTE